MSENLFGSIAAQYAQFRPVYPEALFDELARLAPGRSLAWDCATGAGQAAAPLAERFERVIATDASAEMLAQAPRHARIEHRVADARDSGLEDGVVELVTVANAMHWFHGQEFEREVRRVLAPRGVIAAWCYKYPRVSPGVDALVRRLHDVVIDEFWSEPNRVVERDYRDLWFPFERIAVPPFEASARADLPAFTGYLGTWSAAVKYRRARGRDPLDEIRAGLERNWGEPALVRDVSWPLVLFVGRC